MNYWQRKIAAYLHHSPDKVVGLLDHESRARDLARGECLTPETTGRKDADWAASAADRLPWPQARHCRSEFDAKDNALRHPLGGSAISFQKGFYTADEALVVSQANKPALSSDDPRASFIAIWRLWQNWASAADERFSCLPAETRLPDHTIWNHLAVTSAMQGCFGGSLHDWIESGGAGRESALPDRPAFLLFSIGPVQDFIAAARNTRDLWSGSYLLSYLAATALKEVALNFGPDHVIFPNLAGQPMIDMLLKEDIWEKLETASHERAWEAFKYDSERLLTPTLPNRFLAMLPHSMTEHPDWAGTDEQGRKGAAKFAAHLEQVVRRKLHAIAESVAECCADKIRDFPRARFYHQTEEMLEVHWQVLPWPESIEEVIAAAAKVPSASEGTPLEALKEIQAMLNRMPPEHRDPRYFRDGNVGAPGKAGPLKQVSPAWPALYAVASWQLDAVKATRHFKAWSTGQQQSGKDRNKDALNGREEACFIVPENAEHISEQLAQNSKLFKKGDRIGASTLIKRLWHHTWLTRRYAFNIGDFNMPNTRSIAEHKPFAANADGDEGAHEDGRYFAILALDGDKMGQWVAGTLCPPLKGQLSSEAREYFASHGNAAFLKSRRPLSPSFHLQFSELLGNFSLHCVRRIVQAFDGRLIYAGGDDVLAMLPADTALACARALRAAFRGELELPELACGVIRGRGHERISDRSTRIFNVSQAGFLRLTQDAAPKGYGDKAGLVDEPVNFPFLVPGPATDCSVGIAIAHFKAPLQDVVREAQAAEKRAKAALGRGAVAVTLIKRGGEINHWGCKWDSHGLEVLQEIHSAMDSGQISAKFPHRVIELLEPYLLRQSADHEAKIEPEFAKVAADIIRHDFLLALERQCNAHGETRKMLLETLGRKLGDFLESLASAAVKREPNAGKLALAQTQLESVIGLCRTASFAFRTRSGKPDQLETSAPPSKL